MPQNTRKPDFMPPITIRLQPHRNTARQTQYTCRLAGSLIQLDTLTDALRPFHIQTGIAPAPRDPLPPPIRPNHPPISRLRAFLATKDRDITCWAVQDGYRLEVEDAGMFSIDGSGMHIAHLSAGEADLDQRVVEIGVIGPALAIALAHHRVYLMHCGAVTRDGGAILFLGDSRAGKSTLSAHLYAAGWGRLGDDGMPITLREDRAVAMPHYPQLKLGRDAQIGKDAPLDVPICAIYTLDSSDARAEPAILPLPSREAARALIFHTSAVSLFASSLLVTHGAVMARIAAGVPIKRLVYPHRWEVMDRVGKMIVEDLIMPS